jgi:hypothetical protein
MAQAGKPGPLASGDSCHGEGGRHVWGNAANRAQGRRVHIPNPDVLPACGDGRRSGHSATCRHNNRRNHVAATDANRDERDAGVGRRGQAATGRGHGHSRRRLALGIPSRATEARQREGHGTNASNRNALVEARVRLVAESKAKLDETKKAFIARASKLVESTIESQIRNELTQLKEDIKEMFTNRLAHLFLIHILLNLDDTTLSKKKILTVT